MSVSTIGAFIAMCVTPNLAKEFVIDEYRVWRWSLPRRSYREPQAGGWVKAFSGNRSIGSYIVYLFGREETNASSDKSCRSSKDEEILDFMNSAMPLCSGLVICRGPRGRFGSFLRCLIGAAGNSGSSAPVSAIFLSNYIYSLSVRLMRKKSHLIWVCSEIYVASSRGIMILNVHIAAEACEIPENPEMTSR